MTIPSPPSRRFLGLLAEIRSEADSYTQEEAAALYVNHPEGLPNLEKNCLLIGPLGSGKTIMLKALCAQWAGSSQLEPVFVDLSRWTGQIAGETDTYSSDALSPRGKAVLDAMSLSVVVGLCASTGAFDQGGNIHTTEYSELLSLFPDEVASSDPPSLKSRLTTIVRDALITGQPLPKLLPTVYAAATALGADIRRTRNKKLVLLVDQIDQVSAPFFSPIATLLRRSSHYISVLAMRPCPTAPEPELVPGDIVSGDSYEIIQLGKTTKGDIPYPFVLEFIQALPIEEPFRTEVEDRASLIGNLMWPSLRFAISTILRFVRLRKENVNTNESWYRALTETARGYEDIFKDGLRGWSNPSSMLKDWRRKVLGTKGGQTQIGRSFFVLPKTGLFGDLKGKPSQRLIRLLLKRGILLLGPGEHYVPGTIPLICEVAPLLMVNAPNIDLGHFNPSPLAVDISQEALEKWSRSSGGVPRLRSKRVFVSYWMSEPEGKKSDLIDIVKSKFRNDVDVVTGTVHGSPKWSAEIIEKISNVDLVLCDLSVPRRDCFVEYGVAIGKHIPVIQCVSSSAKEDFPAWIRARQNQYFATIEKHNYDVENSIAFALDSEPDLKRSWKRDSMGRNLDASHRYNMIAFVGPSSAIDSFRTLDATARESNFDLRFYPVSQDSDDLEVIIAATRSVGTLILAFDYTTNDYLCCLAGGIFTTRQRRKSAPIYSLNFLLLNLSPGRASRAIPGLLSTHPLSIMCQDENELHSKFSKRLDELKQSTSKKRGRHS